MDDIFIKEEIETYIIETNDRFQKELLVVTVPGWPAICISSQKILGIGLDNVHIVDFANYRKYYKSSYPIKKDDKLATVIPLKRL